MRAGEASGKDTKPVSCLVFLCSFYSQRQNSEMQQGTSQSHISTSWANFKGGEGYSWAGAGRESQIPRMYAWWDFYTVCISVQTACIMHLMLWPFWNSKKRQKTGIGERESRSYSTLVYTHFIILINCVCVGTLWIQRMTWKLLSSMWVPRIELRMSGLAESAHRSWANLTSPKFLVFFFCFFKLCFLKIIDFGWGKCMYRGTRTTCENVSSPLPSCGFWKLNSGCQTWWPWTY